MALVAFQFQNPFVRTSQNALWFLTEPYLSRIYCYSCHSRLFVAGGNILWLSPGCNYVMSGHGVSRVPPISLTYEGKAVGGKKLH